ncbi:non-ribosomal peptide synthetase [Coleofasciculus sp. FACHB-1120]|uniref:non-ribosomal peptide synthetase n=1 Tax=Coleofasciculus sp. FACHB-1120 TaxID=2692783 RepID=UPI00168468B4|nr:non-ribosomal peptide synthetase [Coleofasciculus sp. FACHB-1120]MBD2741475.1 amino acid adenylation domain-containing protein [Coleofasciculus sp. FACHB-1120]
MSNLSERIAGLSPEKRELLLKRLNQKKEPIAPTQIPRQNRDSNSFPLSFAQQRLWFFDQLDPGNTSYNISAAVRVKGTLDAIALEQSLNAIIQRHEVLRTAFTTVNGQPVQVITPDFKFTLPLIDLRSLSNTEREQAVRQFATAEAQKPFDLTQAPLLRVRLLHLNEFEYVVLFTMHHIVSDGWSMGIFIQELVTFYKAFACRDEINCVSTLLPELSIQYADFAVWQRQWLQGEVLEAQIAYWKKQLGGNLPVLDLPTDRPRPAVQTFQGAEEKFVLSKALIEELTKVGQQQGATLFIVLLAAFKTLLYRYTGQEDILVGSPIANRNRAELEGLIGFFANTLVLRTDLANNPTFKELLGRVREVALGAYSHQDLPFEKLVEVLQPNRDLSRNPLFQVLFALRNVPTQTLELPGVRLSLEEMESQTARFDFVLNLAQESEGLTGIFEYNKNLFDASTIQRMAGHFQTLLESIVANSDRAISTLPFLTQPEQHQLLWEWNNTHTNDSPDRCLHELFEEQAERTPDAIAVVFDNQQLTYAELNTKAHQLAHHLQKLGVKPEVLVGICVERSLEMVIGLLGILKAGGAYLPLDPAYPPERLAFMLEDAQVPVLLTQKRLLNLLPSQNAQVVCLDSDWGNQQIHSQNPIPNPSNLAYVIYTSGSTGRPKGVQISHACVVNFLISMRQKLGINQLDILLAVTSLSFDIAALEIFLPITVGSRVVVVSREIASDGAQLLTTLTDSGATIMQATPATWRMLLAAGWQGNKNLKILCGGEALPRQLAAQLLVRGDRLWNLYGPTETTIWSTIHLVESRDAISIGRPIANTQVYILDRSLQPVPVGVTGELYIGGKGLSRGYLNRPELTAEKFIANPFLDQSEKSELLYKTGDLARYLPNGELEYLGRIDHQVKVRGFRIELGEIEAVLSQHPAVQQAVVIAREANSSDKNLLAYVVPMPAEAATTPAQLRSFLKEKLPDYMVPSAFVLLEAIPLTPNGKIDRRALPEPDTTRPELERIFVSPRTAMEEVVAGIWTQVLGLQQVGVCDRFFDLGGHSLLATQVMSRLREAFQVELPLRYLFESPTVAGLAERIETACRAQQGLQTPPLVPVVRDREFPLSFAQQRLWFLDQLNPGDSAYNIPAAVRLVGALNIVALEQSFQEIIQRHEALRTIFATVEGQPVQVIIPSATFKLPVIDLRQLPPSEREAEVLRLATEEAQRPFDLTQLPLLRVTLLQLDEAENAVLLTLHHIIADGWSMGVLIREVAALYEAFCARKPSPLPELPIQYADYAVWQRQWLQGEVLEAKLDYWKQQLGHNPPQMKLPTKQPAASTFQAGIQSFELSPKLSGALNVLSRQEGVTLFMTLLAAFQTLLHRYTSQDDIIVGTDVANRTQVETELLIGFFVNILVLRTDMRGNPTFRELLKRVRDITLKAYVHQDLPFEKLVEELRPERNLSRTPLFQVLFVMQNTPVPTLEVSGLTLTPIEVEGGTAKFDLVLFVSETKDGIVGSWKYNADLFDADAIARLSAHFETLLNSIVAQPDTRLNPLEILTEAEKKQQAMQEIKREKSNFSKFKNIKPKAVTLPKGELVKTEYLQAGETFPLVLKPAVNEVDIVDWAKNNQDFIETKLLQHGGILFRGFNEPLVSVFEQFAQAICPQLFGEYGDLPREGVSGQVYGSTPYPADKAILFHNESSHLHRWPLKIWFFCVKAAQQGGETPIIDSRKVYHLLNSQLQERFAQKQIMYVRNYTDGLDVSWQEFFRTTDKSVVEDYCRKAAIEFEWREDNGLRTRQIRPAISKHPKTGETVFFNQLFLHHISCLDPAVRASLLSVFGEENLPRNVYYGDGTTIEDSVIAEIQEVYRQASVSFPWQEGDILMLDNMLAAHSRNPFVGSRKIVVAMGEMMSDEERCRPAGE